MTGSGVPGMQGSINNYLIPAILSTICCCPPFGIVSIVYAAQVNGLLAAGNIDGARKAADSAKMWFWISFGVGVAWTVIATGVSLLQIIAIGAGAANR